MNFRHFAAGTALSAAVLFSGLANAAITWNISGPGSTNVSSSGNVTDATYSVGGYGSTNTWTVSGVSDSAGDLNFDWNFSGFHSWYLASASLDAFGGSSAATLFPWGGVSGGFNVGGNYTFTDVAVGDIIGFSISGYHYDIAQAMSGTLHLAQIPEPSALALAGLGLLGVFASRRKQ